MAPNYETTVLYYDTTLPYYYSLHYYTRCGGQRNWLEVAPILCEGTAPCPTQAYPQAWAVPVHSGAPP